MGDQPDALVGDLELLDPEAGRDERDEVEIPAPLFSLALIAARAGGKAGGIGEAAVARLRDDLVFDAAPARRDLGYAPRRFDAVAAAAPAPAPTP